MRLNEQHNPHSDWLVKTTYAEQTVSYNQDDSGICWAKAELNYLPSDICWVNAASHWCIIWHWLICFSQIIAYSYWLLEKEIIIYCKLVYQL